MGVLADHQIIGRLRFGDSDPQDPVLGDIRDKGLVIRPFTKQCPNGVISYGISSYGYDIQVGYKFKVFTPVHCGEIDPKNFDEKSLVDVDLTQNAPHHLEFCNTTESWRCKNCGITLDINQGSVERDVQTEGTSCPKGKPNFLRIPPNSFALAESLQYLEIPRDVIGIVLGKSSYARCGIIVNVTPLEPRWVGKITMEISNTAPLPARIYTGEGIAQILFLKGDAECDVSYEDKKGVYQAQTSLTLPRVKS